MYISSNNIQTRYLDMISDLNYLQDNMTLKCQGITKLVYLQMLGYEMSWSNFNTIEVSFELNTYKKYKLSEPMHFYLS